MLDNFDEDEIVRGEDVAVSGTQLSDEDLAYDSGGTTFTGGGGSSSASSSTKYDSSGNSAEQGKDANGKISQKKPNGYPCKIYCKQHNRSQELTKPLTYQQCVSKIKSEPVASRVKYLCLHVTAQHLDTTHIDLIHYFLQSKDGGWSRSGYHISFQADGTCMKNLPDDTKSNGVGYAYQISPVSNWSMVGIF